MSKKLLFSLFLAASFLASIPSHAQQAEHYEYGGSTDPLGTGAMQQAVKAKPSGSPVFLRGTGPINLRPGAYISHDPAQVEAQPQDAAKPKPTSTIIYNQSLQDKKRANMLDESPFPPGWGDYPR